MNILELMKGKKMMVTTDMKVTVELEILKGLSSQTIYRDNQSVR